MPKGNESVLIAGAGPAGCVAAALLARAGRAVTLIEQSRFPRDKVCGECLSALGARALAASGLSAGVDALRPVPLKRARFVARGGEAAELALPAPMLGLTREAMDSALLEAARSAGARLIQPARAESIVAANDKEFAALLVRDLNTNETSWLTGSLLLVADGRSALLGRKPPTTGDLGLKAHFEDVRADADAIGLFGLRGQYVGIAPVSDGRRVIWNLAAAVPAKRVRAFGGDHEGLLASMRRENPGLDSALRHAMRIGPWLACPLPRFAVRRNWPTRVIPLGNAAAALEPIGGEGMGLAIASAALAGRFIVEGRTSPAELLELRREYTRLWRRRRLVWRALAMTLCRPGLAGAGIRAAGAAPGLAARCARLLQEGLTTVDVVSRRGACVLS